MNDRGQPLSPQYNHLSQDVYNPLHSDDQFFIFLLYEDDALLCEDGALLCDGGALLCDDALPHDDVSLLLEESKIQFHDVRHDALVLGSCSISHPGILQELVLDARMLDLLRIHKLVFQTGGGHQGREPCDEVYDGEYLLGH